MAEKKQLIIDLGRIYIKIGFEGECSPRHILPSPLFHKLYSTDFLSWIDLIQFLFVIIYDKIAPSRSKDHGVVILEPMVGFTTQCRQALIKILFERFQVPRLCMYPSILSSLYTTGVNSGLLIDIGSTECTILPVYEGHPVIGSWRTFPIGTLHLGIELIEELKSSNDKNEMNGEGPDQVYSPVDKLKEYINNGFFNDLLTRRDAIYHQIYSKSTLNGDAPLDSNVIRTKHRLKKTGGIERFDYFLQHRHQFLEDKVKKMNDINKSLTFGMIENILFQCCFFKYQTLEKSDINDLSYNLDDGKVLNIPGTVRVDATDLLFNYGEGGLQHAVLDTLDSLPVDIRRNMCGHIIISGGGSLLTGIQYRLAEEIVNATVNPLSPTKYFNLRNLFISQHDIFMPESPFPSHVLGWIGGSIIATSELLNEYSLTLQEYTDQETKIVPDFLSSNPSEWYFMVPNGIREKLDNNSEAEQQSEPII